MQRMIGCSTPESKLVESPTVDEPVRYDLLKSSDSVKQEVNKAQCASFDILFDVQSFRVDNVLLSTELINAGFRPTTNNVTHVCDFE